GTPLFVDMGRCRAMAWYARKMNDIVSMRKTRPFCAGLEAVAKGKFYQQGLSQGQCESAVRSFRTSARSHKCDHDNFRPRAQAHRRSPAASAIRRKYLELTEALQAMDELAPDPLGDPGIRKELAAVRMP